VRIAQVNVYFYPAMVGGAEWYVYNVSRQLVKRGHEVHVYTCDSYRGKKIGPSEEQVEGIEVHRLPLRADFTYRAKIWKNLRQALAETDHDVIHTYDYAQPHSYTATRVAESLGRPSVLTVFDIHSMIPRRFYKQFFMRMFDKFLARLTLGHADRILVRAPNLISNLLEMGTPKDRIVVTPSGIEDEALKPADGSVFLARYSIEKSPVILFLGRLNPLKGPQHIVMAAPKILSKYPDAGFVFVGEEQGGYRKKLEALSREMGVSKNVFFTGPIYDIEAKNQAYAACNVFALPSSYEGTSQSIFQAMAQAKPVVATDRGGIPFQVDDGKEGILVEYGDQGALADAILKLLDDPGLSASLGRNAKEKVKRLVYTNLTQQVETIYKEIPKRG